MPSEIQPLETRAAGMGIATLMNFLFTFLIGQIFLVGIRGGGGVVAVWGWAVGSWAGLPGGPQLDWVVGCGKPCASLTPPSVPKAHRAPANPLPPPPVHAVRPQVRNLLPVRR